MNRQLTGRRAPRSAAVAALAVALVAGCSSAAEPDGSGSASDAASGTQLSVQNCGETLTLDSEVQRLFANDGNIISIALAAGAHDQLTAVSSVQRDQDVLALKFGADQVDDLNVVAEKYPTLENILAADPDLVFAGWNYGFSEASNLTPDILAEHDIPSYLLSETCLQSDGARGTMPPWEALTTDITNIGTLTGNPEPAATAVQDIETRKAALEAAPQATDKPTAFLFDSGTEAIYTSGSFGAPQAIFDTAGVQNAAADVQDTWTEVSWERLNSSDPDIIYFVDYPGQTLEQKIAVLEANPASQNLTAVKEKRYVNLPYALWTSGPLNIDAAEYVRISLEHYGLQPDSGIEPQIDLTQLQELPGNEWLRQQ